MGRIQAGASAVIDGRPEEIYDILSDYKTKHPKILPKEHFKDLVVEAGGEGAGTVIRFKTIAAGRERPYRMEISEPEPGRVLVESDKSSNTVTTFTVTPVSEGRQSQVQIITEFDASPGIAGFFERMLSPRLLKGIYEKELRQLAQVVAQMKPRQAQSQLA